MDLRYIREWGYQINILADTVIVLSVCIIIKIVSKHSHVTTFVESYTFEAWGPVQEAYVVMRLDLSEITCTPAIDSWTLERHNIQNQSPES